MLSFFIKKYQAFLKDLNYVLVKLFFQVNSFPAYITWKQEVDLHKGSLHVRWFFDWRKEYLKRLHLLREPGRNVVTVNSLPYQWGKINMGLSDEAAQEKLHSKEGLTFKRKLLLNASASFSWRAGSGEMQRFRKRNVSVQTTHLCNRNRNTKSVLCSHTVHSGFSAFDAQCSISAVELSLVFDSRVFVRVGLD